MDVCSALTMFIMHISIYILVFARQHGSDIRKKPCGPDVPKCFYSARVLINTFIKLSCDFLPDNIYYVIPFPSSFVYLSR